MGWTTTLGRDPQRELDALVAQLERSGAPGGLHRHGGVAVGVLPGRGFTLTLAVADVPRFAPAEFVVLTQVDGALKGELLTSVARTADSGHLAQTDLEGAALAEYLARTGLRIDGLQALLATRWAAVKAGK